MHYMFMGASAFNQPLHLDTSSVTMMRGMFRGASAFNQPLSFETSSVTDMSQMFYQASAFNQPLSFDTSGVVTDIQATCGGQPCPYSGMSGTFDGTSALSDANKLLIRCAWAGESAFDSEYGSSWVSGTCPPPPAPPPAPPPSPPDLPYIASVSGGCQYAQASASMYACVCSPNWVGACTPLSVTASIDGPRPSTGVQYNNDESCLFKFTQPATLRVEYFSTESGWDTVRVNGEDYSGDASSGPTGPLNGKEAASLSWSTDGSVVDYGFRICLTEIIHSPPPLPPPSPPPPSPPPSPPPPSPRNTT